MTMTLELTKSENCNPKFEVLFLEAVDSAFAMMGDHARRRLWIFVENRIGVNQIENGSDLEGFAEALEDVLGPAAQLVEMRIMQYLHDRVPSFRYSLTKGELSFLSYVQALQHYV